MLAKGDFCCLIVHARAYFGVELFVDKSRNLGQPLYQFDKIIKL